MKLSRRRPCAALTLIELLCVMAIVAILVGLMLGPIAKAFSHAKKVLGQ